MPATVGVASEGRIALGSQLAGRYVEGVGEPETVRLAPAALVVELRRDLRT